MFAHHDTVKNDLKIFCLAMPTLLSVLFGNLHAVLAFITPKICCLNKTLEYQSARPATASGSCWPCQRSHAVCSGDPC